MGGFECNVCFAGARNGSFELPEDIADHMVFLLVIPWDPASIPSLASLSVASKSWARLMLARSELWRRVAACLWPECCLAPELYSAYANIHLNPWLGMVADHNRIGAFPTMAM